jgi:hypothetical protein
MIGSAEQARNWVHTKYSKDPHVGPLAATESYVDLIFSFGLARLGEAEASKALLQRARSGLENKDEIHTFLLKAYTFRIEQALAGKAHTGLLPQDQLDSLNSMATSPRYTVDRLRQQSRVLEPDQKIEPYRHIYARMGGIEKDLAELPDVTERKELARRVGNLLQVKKTHEERARILKTALDLAPRGGKDFALSLLSEVVPTCDSLGEPSDAQALLNQAALLEKALFAAAHFGQAEPVRTLVGRFRKLLTTQRSRAAVEALGSLTGESFRALRKLGLRDETELLLRQTTDWIVEVEEAKKLPELLARPNAGANPQWPASVRVLLHVAAGWLYLGQVEQAEPLLNAARSLLFANTLPNREQAPLARVYVQALGQAPLDVMQPRIDELFKNLDGIRDTFTTNGYYGLHQLTFVEAVVLACVDEP